MDLTRRIGASLRSYENGSSVTNKKYLCEDVMADGAGHPPTSAVEHRYLGPTPAWPWGFPGGRGYGGAEHRAGCSIPPSQPRDGAAAAPCHGVDTGRGGTLQHSEPS